MSILTLVLAVIQGISLLVTWAFAVAYRECRKAKLEELRDLSAAKSTLQLEVKKLTPPVGQFRYEWVREDMPDAEFRDVVRFLVERDSGKIVWDADVLDIPSHRRNTVKVHTTDKTEAVLFKLTFGGAV